MRAVVASAWLLCAPAAAGDPCPRISLHGDDPGLNEVEKRLVCGSQDSEGWKEVPLPQAEKFMRAFLQRRGYHFPAFAAEDERLDVRVGTRTLVTQLVSTGLDGLVDLGKKRGFVGKPLTPFALDKLRTEVATKLQEQGFACPTLSVSADARTGVVRLDAEPGVRYVLTYVHAPPVEGIDPGVFNRFQAHQYGYPFDIRLLNLTSERVMQEALFQSAYFDVACTTAGLRVTQRVVEAKPRLITVGFGVDTEGYARSRLRWRHSRLGYRASSADANLFLSFREQELDAFLRYYLRPADRIHLQPRLQALRLNEERFETIETKLSLSPAWTWDDVRLHLEVSGGPALERFDTRRGAGPTNDTFASFETRVNATSHLFEYYQRDPRQGWQAGVTTSSRAQAAYSRITANRLRVFGEKLWNLGHYDPPWLVLAALVWRPEWALTPPRLTSLVERFGKSYHPRWRNFEPRLRSESFLVKRLTLRASGLSFHDSTGTLKGRFESLDLDASARLTFRGPVLTRLRRLDARLDDFTLKLASQTVEIQASLAYSSGLVLAAAVYRDTPEKTENLDVKLTLESDVFSTGELSYLSLHGRVKGDVEDSALVDARIEKLGAEKRLTGEIDARSSGKTLRARVDGASGSGKYAGRLTGSLVDPDAALRSIAVERCDVEAPYDEAGALERLSLRCLVGLEPQPFGVKPGAKAKTIDMRLALDGSRAASGLGKDAFEADLKADVEPRKDWYEFKAAFAAHLAGRLGDLPRSLESRHTLDAGLKVAKFEDLVAYLDGTKYAVPAPLHVLRGPLEAGLKGAGDSGSDPRLDFAASTDLDSGRQKLLVKAAGSIEAENAFTPRRRLSVRAAVVLRDVRLELPWLKIGQLPRVSVDPRIKTGRETAVAPSRPPAARPKPAVDYAVTVKTEKPVTFYTNINPAPVPIALDLAATPPGLQGRIAVQPFDAELFKKKGHIVHVTLAPKPGSRSMDIDGLVEFKEPDADIRVKLLGSTEKPRVVFESEPPMDQQAVIALLLFGKTPDDLDPDQHSSVSNSQSAMANGAFGLASLYLFASTPVQHVGYDPSTQTYAIKFSLPGGASLEVGSGADQSTRLTLRKRLARRWVVETELERDPERQRSGVSTFLQWFQRY